MHIAIHVRRRKGRDNDSCSILRTADAAGHEPRITCGTSPQLQLEAALADRVGPFPDFLRHEVILRRDRISPGRHSVFHQPLTEIGILSRVDHRAVELLHDVIRDTLGSGEPLPARDHEIGIAAFFDGRDVGQQWAALHAGRGDDPDPGVAGDRLNSDMLIAMPLPQKNSA